MGREGKKDHFVAAFLKDKKQFHRTPIVELKGT